MPRVLPAAAARNARAPEYRIAESKGFLLEAPLGKGHFGRVYRGRKRTSGQVRRGTRWLAAQCRGCVTCNPHQPVPAVPAEPLLRPAVQLVAIKVIDLLPSQRSQVLAAYRECQLLSSVQHDNIVRVFTFYTAKVQRTQRLVEVM